MIRLRLILLVRNSRDRFSANLNKGAIMSDNFSYGPLSLSKLLGNVYSEKPESKICGSQ